MTEDLETRLRTRLLALSEAVPVEPISATLATAQRARIGPARPRRRATTMGSLAALAVALVVLVAVGSRFAGSGGTQASSSAPTASLATQPSPTASDNLSDLVVSCELATADCQRALPATLDAVRGVGALPAHVTFAQPMLCSQPMFLDGPIAGLCVVNPPPHAPQRLGHAVVTFQGISRWAYLNLWAGASSTIAQLIAVRSEPAYWDHATGPSPAPSAFVMPSLPPGGISPDAAIAIARQHITLATFVSAEAGTFAELNHNPNIAQVVKPDRLVWAVTFEGDLTICPPPPGATCATGVPGVATAFLDYYTGDFILGGGGSG